MGCGACVHACPNNALSLTNILDKGIRPSIDDGKCQSCSSCLAVCPGASLSHESSFGDGVIDGLGDVWGPVREIWEGCACDREIRFKGSSGGGATAVALYCLEKENASGVVHVGVKTGDPISNHAVLSTTRDELVSRSGSRYGPAAACERFDLITSGEGKFVFIGKPCDVAALSKARKLNPELDEKILLTISIFCAGTPNTLGTHNVLKTMGITDPDAVEIFRYRGHGWPGDAVAKLKNSGKKFSMTYSRMWGGILSKHGQLRCRLCADSTGEFADISCGDPWYRDIRVDEDGYSMLIARTDNGVKFIRECMRSGYLELKNAEPCNLKKSQESIYDRRCELWGRLLAFKIFGIPCPEFRNMNLSKSWRSITIAAKLKSVLSTVKRIIKRKLYHPEN